MANVYLDWSAPPGRTWPMSVVAHIAEFCILAAERRKLLGSKSFAAICHACRMLGASWISIEVDKDQDRANAFWAYQQLNRSVSINRFIYWRNLLV